MSSQIFNQRPWSVQLGVDHVGLRLRTGDPLAQEWFVLALGPGLAITLCGLDGDAHVAQLTPVREYLWQVTSFRGLRAWDIAGLVGADRTLPAELVSGMWEQLSPVADQWRQMGVFGPAAPVPADADLQDRLLGLTGRTPA